MTRARRFAALTWFAVVLYPSSVLCAAGCSTDPVPESRPGSATEAFSANGPDSDLAATVADSLYGLFLDLNHGWADSTVAASHVDSLAAQLRTQDLNGYIVDSLDFDGDGVEDRLIATEGRGGIFGALYLADGDSLHRAGHDLSLGQEFAVCHGTGRTARILSYEGSGVQFDVWSAEWRIADGRITLESQKSFTVWPNGDDDSPATEEREAEANRLRARTEGPPAGCAFRCTYLRCCTAGNCPANIDDGTNAEPPRSNATGA